MQKGTGKSHYSYELLARVADTLDLPVDRVTKAFYPPAPRDPTFPSDAELTAQQVMTQFAPYLAKIDAIPELQTDVAAIKACLNGVVDAINEVNDRLATVVVDITRTHPTE
jgi:hypothetical protein